MPAVSHTHSRYLLMDVPLALNLNLLLTVLLPTKPPLFARASLPSLLLEMDNSIFPGKLVDLLPLTLLNTHVELPTTSTVLTPTGRELTTETNSDPPLLSLLELTNFKDALPLLARLLTASELFLPAALKALLDPLLLTHPQTTLLPPSVASKTCLLSEILEMEVLVLLAGKLVQVLLHTLLNTLAETCATITT